MKSRLALVAVVDAYDGPWARIEERSARFEVRGLGEEEHVAVQFDESTEVGVQLGELGLTQGVNLLMTQNWLRYRVCKSTLNGAHGSPTTVEVFPS